MWTATPGFHRGPMAIGKIRAGMPGIAPRHDFAAPPRHGWRGPISFGAGGGGIGTPP